MQQIAYWKKGKTKNSTPEVEVMTNAALKAPMHPQEQVKSFGKVSKDDHHETCCAE
jgi:hypothetical protein